MRLKRRGAANLSLGKSQQGRRAYVPTVRESSHFSFLKRGGNCPNITKGVMHPCPTNLKCHLLHVPVTFLKALRSLLCSAPTCCVSKEIHFSGSLPSGFYAGLASGRHWQSLEGGKRREVKVFLPHLFLPQVMFLAEAVSSLGPRPLGVELPPPSVPPARHPVQPSFLVLHLLCNQFPAWNSLCKICLVRSPCSWLSGIDVQHPPWVLLGSFPVNTFAMCTSTAISPDTCYHHISNRL